ncbi:MAG: ABC transporter six-transmembrane domain-containing protein [Xanthomonadaceae bacterium]|jgi:hypothetical protein|nr:ABC transporter six-transmembrane domain-containing protein [Xanthomonadaceae bacterium]
MSSPSTPARVLLARLLGRHRRGIGFAYGLLALETLLDLLRPAAWGLSIDALLSAQPAGLGWAVAQHLAHLAAGTARRAVDTRVFTRAYEGLATGVVLEQRGAGRGTSEVAARGALAREFVTFLERDLPDALRGVGFLVGGCLALGLYEPVLVLLVAALAVPVALLNRRYARVSARLNRGLNDRIEREVAVVEAARPRTVAAHFAALSRWRVRLSDAESFNFAATEAFILAVVVGSLAIAAGDPAVSAGTLFAVLSYLWLVVYGIDQVPRLVEQWAKLRDVARRLAA